MQVDFSRTIKTIDGSKDLLLPDNTAVTLAVVVVNALLTEVERDAAQNKLRCYTLARKVQAGGSVDLESEDIAFIKDRVGMQSGPLVVGQAFALLEGKEP